MFIGKMSDDMINRIMADICDFNGFIDAVLERNEIDIGDDKEEFIKDSMTTASDVIRGFFENEFFDKLEDCVIELYDNKYEVKENK